MGLGDQLRAAIQWQAGTSGKGFIPLDQLDTIITRQSIERELLDTPRLFSLLSEQGDALVDNILGLNSQSSRSTRKVKLLAILALLGCVERIADFVDNGSNDNILPVHIESTTPGSESTVLAQDRKTSLRACFRLWDLSAIEAFEEQQWVVLAPVFSQNLPFISLSSKAVLPFIRDDAHAERRGGTSRIFRVKIHPSHIKTASKEPMLMFAVKRVRSIEKDSFCRELEALRRFNSPGVPQHPNILEFLSAWQQDGYFNIMFPWAVGDLSDWWRNNPLPATGPGFKTTLWLSKQCLGIASGLSAVHQFLRTSHTSDPNSVGHHGDIKPANILWFPDPVNPDMMGTWKIADFGLSGVGLNSTVSGSKRLGCTPAYRAPEYDIEECEIGVAYDIWSLGCVLLECLTWSLVGLDGIRELEARRLTTSSLPNAEKGDNAFWETTRAIDKSLLSSSQTQFAVKAVVTKWMDRLRSDGQEQPPAVCKHIDELSTLIGNNMLVINDTQRSTSSEVVTKLQQMHDRFLEQTVQVTPLTAECLNGDKIMLEDVTSMNMSHTESAIYAGRDKGDARITDFANSIAQTAPGMALSAASSYSKPTHTESVTSQSEIPFSQQWSPLEQTAPTTSQKQVDTTCFTEPNYSGTSFGDAYEEAICGSKRPHDTVAGATEQSVPTKYRRLQPTIKTCHAISSSGATKGKTVGQPAAGVHSSKNTTATPGALRFACPFHKYDPQTFGIHDPRWRTCVGPGWTTIHRVKEHIDRKHTVQPNTCSRCLTAFRGPRELDQHQKSETPCQVSHENHQRVTEAQRALMRKRPRGRSEVGAWNDIYRIIFGLAESDSVPWPYCESAASPEEESPKPLTQPSMSSLEQFDEFLTQSVMPGADKETMTKIEGYLDLARQFRQFTTCSANETVLSSVPSLISDSVSQMAHNQASHESLMESSSMQFPASEIGTNKPAQQISLTCDPMDLWNPSSLTKEEEELSRMLFNDLGSQEDDHEWQHFFSNRA